MQKYFEKIIEWLEEQQEEYIKDYNRHGDGEDYRISLIYDRAIEIVNQVAEEFGSDINVGSNDGWIPVSSGKLPDTNEAVNITWVNRKPPSYYADIKDKPFTATGHYHNGRWYWYSCVCKDYLDEYGDSIGDRMDGNIEVIAWQPLPTPYQPKGEEA